MSGEEKMWSWFWTCGALLLAFITFTIRSCNVELARLELEKVKIPHSRSVEVTQKATVQSSGEQK